MAQQLGQTVQYTYELWGPVQEIQHFAYDLVGNLTGATDDSIQSGPLYAITYDASNRPDGSETRVYHGHTNLLGQIEIVKRLTLTRKTAK